MPLFYMIFYLRSLIDFMQMDTVPAALGGDAQTVFAETAAARRAASDKPIALAAGVSKPTNRCYWLDSRAFPMPSGAPRTSLVRDQFNFFIGIERRVIGARMGGSLSSLPPSA